MPEETTVNNFPPQRITNSKKGKKWREDCVRFAENFSVFGSSAARKGKRYIQRNYRLYGGKLDMHDIESILNPEGMDYGVETKKIQHYPVMNTKLELLLGEERNTILEDRVVVTNPSSISEIEQGRIEEIKRRLQEDITNTSYSDQERQMRLQEMELTFNYDYQDLREKNANDILNHFKAEYNFKGLYNEGYMDALVAAQEIYHVFIEGGSPKIERVNLREISVWGSTSNRIEDYPYLVRERFLSGNDILDMWGDLMSEQDYKKFDRMIKEAPQGHNVAVPQEYFHFRYGDNPDFVTEEEIFNFDDNVNVADLPYNIAGNIRVLEVYWKSMSPVYAVHYYDENGEEQIKFRTSDYIVDKDAGEFVKKYWKNEAWHGVMIGAGEQAIFVDVGPCQVQYNRMGNPSKCHFGFIGNIYNNNDYDGMSVVDKLKPLSYKYDVTMAKLDSLMARNYGKMPVMDAARVPAGWEAEKWAYFVKLGFFVVDSMKEGSMGAAKGKLAGGVANTPLVVDAEMSASIQSTIEQLMFIEQSMEKMLGITPQRMGSIQNRETVGGVERAVMQSSNVTQAFASRHEDLKKRVEECFIENAKIAMRGKNPKFQFILSDGTIRNVTIDGDQFAESDYGIVIMTGYDVQSLQQSIDMLAQAKAQNNLMSSSTYLELKQMTSLSEKIKTLKREEAQMRQQAQQAQQQEAQQAQQQMQIQMQIEQAKLELQREINMRDNETRILVAQINANSNAQRTDTSMNEEAQALERDKLNQEMEKFNRQLDLERDKIQSQERMNRENNQSKERIAKSKTKSSNTGNK